MVWYYVQINKWRYNKVRENNKNKSIRMSDLVDIRNRTTRTTKL